ncbi:MAG TPA: 4Fe-4S dicluster domain-containing protein [Terriglobales bacterium]|nr:4Fe-4S dicluster domain-containing protein [Terriglobales bacterium]
MQTIKLATISARPSVAAAPAGFPTSANPTRANSVRYHGRRRLVQAISFALAILVPATGLMRIDPSAGALVVLDRQIWFADFFLIAGLWIVLASALVMLYSVAGTVFCGWVCPQNIVSEWANYVTRKFLGRRAKVSLDGAAPLVAATKDKALNWILLGLSLLSAALVVALVPLFYFYPPAVVWSFVTWRVDPHLAASLHYIYFVFASIILLDVAFIRHFWCRFACIYRVWQHSFRTRETLHVRYDASRADRCTKCSYCVSACFIEIDPRKTDTYSSCINCGECVDACNRMHQKSGQPGLLRFEFGEPKAQSQTRSGFRDNATSLAARSKWVLVLGALGVGLFVWGLCTWEPLHVVVYRAEVQQTQSNRDYRIAISNKLYHPRQVRVSVTGLSAADYQLGATEVTLPSAGRESVRLSLSDKLPHGVHAFAVEVTAAGWHTRFPIQHLAE